MFARGSCTGILETTIRAPIQETLLL